MCSNGNKFQLRTWFIKKSNQARSLNSLKASISLEPLPVILLRCRSLVVCITTFPEVIQHLKLLHNLLADRTLDAEEVDCGCPPMQLSCEVTWGDFRLLTELQKIIENVLHCEEWAGGSSTGLALSKSSSLVNIFLAPPPIGCASHLGSQTSAPAALNFIIGLGVISPSSYRSPIKDKKHKGSQKKKLYHST